MYIQVSWQSITNVLRSTSEALLKKNEKPLAPLNEAPLVTLTFADAHLLTAGLSWHHHPQPRLYQLMAVTP